MSFLHIQTLLLAAVLYTGNQLWEISRATFHESCMPMSKLKVTPYLCTEHQWNQFKGVDHRQSMLVYAKQKHTRDASCVVERKSFACAVDCRSLDYCLTWSRILRSIFERCFILSIPVYIPRLAEHTFHKACSIHMLYTHCYRYEYPPM